jgi:hypothetical protein
VTVTSLASQFSDVGRLQFTSRGNAGPPYFPQVEFPTRLGQTVWCCVEASNPSGVDDVYLVVKPFWGSVSAEFREIGPLREPIKRLDIVGVPSPFGSSISQMLGEVWRFFIPAGGVRNYAFFCNAEGFRFALDSWFTDLAGNPINLGTTSQRMWYAVGSPHAAMTSSAPEAAGGEA